MIIFGLAEIKVNILIIILLMRQVENLIPAHFDPGYGLHYKVSFLGYCLLPEPLKFKIVSFLTQKKLFKTTASEKILEIMNINIKKSKPQLLMAHNINPGHVNCTYDDEKSFKEFLKVYQKKRCYHETRD